MRIRTCGGLREVMMLICLPSFETKPRLRILKSFDRKVVRVQIPPQVPEIKGGMRKHNSFLFINLAIFCLLHWSMHLTFRLDQLSRGRLTLGSDEPFMVEIFDQDQMKVISASTTSSPLTSAIRVWPSARSPLSSYQRLPLSVSKMKWALLSPRVPLEPL